MARQRRGIDLSRKLQVEAPREASSEETINISDKKKEKKINIETLSHLQDIGTRLFYAN